MPRKKKDGRFINYYLDRQLFERLEQYAHRNGQPMTTALERILQTYLDAHAPLPPEPASDSILYCPDCNALARHNACPVCGRRKLDPPKPGDYCQIGEIDTIWADALSDILTQNAIPFIRRNLLGAGMTAKIGPAMERTRFYVPFLHYEDARSLKEGFFSANFSLEA